MTATTVVLLILALITVLVVANAIEQYKQKLATERHQLLLKMAAIIQENEELLVNNVQLPMSTVITAMLVRRTIDLLTQIHDMLPESTRVPKRLQETQDHLQSIDTSNKDRLKLLIPNTDEHNAALIKTIKKIRHIMSEQKRNGNLAHKDFEEEDEVLSLYLVRIFVEFKMKQADSALVDNKKGSARQFLEKALKTLRSQPSTGEYVKSKTIEVTAKLDDINADLYDIRAQMGDSEEKPKSVDDLDKYFSDTKRKW